MPEVVGLSFTVGLTVVEFLVEGRFDRLNGFIKHTNSHCGQ